MNFLNPLAALYSLTLVPIVLLYFLKQEKVALIVSSIIPWRELTDTPTSDRRKFNFELLFLLQLLVILTLVLALIRFYILSGAPVKYQILILDASASMLTREKGGSRWEQAKAQALELIEDMPPGERIMLVRAGAYSQQITPFLDSKAKLKKAIQQLKCGETSNRLQAALQLAIAATESADGCKITLFTDRAEPGLRELAGRRRLEFKLFGKRRDNVAITALDVYQGLYDYSQRKAYITLRNYSPGARKFGLKLYLDQQFKWGKNMSLSAGESITLPFGNLNQPGILKAQLVVNDALETDNAAYAIIRPHKLLKWLAVTEDQELTTNLKRIAAAIPGLELTFLTRKQYPPPDIKQYDMATFNHLVPDPIPQLNALYIMPALDNKTFRAKPAKPDDIKIMDWNRKHSILKYLSFLDEVQLTEAEYLDLPAWANVLLKTRNFPLAWEGELQGQRLICLGFEIGDYLFPASGDVTMVVLLLNMLDWLTPQPSSATQIKTGDKYIFQHTAPLRQASIINPKGEKIKLATKKEATISFSGTDYVGPYELSASDVEGKQIKLTFVANLLDETESRIAPTPALPGEPTITPTSPPPVTQAALTQERLELWPYIIMAALCFLFIEWWVYFSKLG